MNRKLAFLTGLAIIAVVLNHATRWGLILQFGWQGQLSPRAIIPDQSQASGLSYYSLVAIQQLCYFGVPAFLFISGFFIAYTAQGTNNGRVSWKVVRTRIYKLFWPYIIWSVAVFIVEGFQGRTFSIDAYFVQLLTGKTLGPYYYVPMLCQLYLLSPFVCRLGKDHPYALLALAGMLQLVCLGYYYLKLGGADLPGAPLENGWLFIWYILYFPLGVVVGFRLKSFQTVITRYRGLLAMLTVVLGATSILEAEWLYHATGNFEATHDMLKLSTNLYATVFILALLAFDWRASGLLQAVNRIGAKSYGIYLLSPAVFFIFAQVMNRFVPVLLSQPLVMILAFTTAGIGGVALAMEFIARSPLRSAYRYLFG